MNKNGQEMARERDLFLGPRRANTFVSHCIYWYCTFIEAICQLMVHISNLDLILSYRDFIPITTQQKDLQYVYRFLLLAPQVTRHVQPDSDFDLKNPSLFQTNYVQNFGSKALVWVYLLCKRTASLLPRARNAECGDN